MPPKRPSTAPKAAAKPGGKDAKGNKSKGDENEPPRKLPAEAKANPSILLDPLPESQAPKMPEMKFTHPSVTEWTVDEDRFIVKTFEFEPETNATFVSDTYMQHKRKQGRVFGKIRPNRETLERRLERLKENKLRYELIQRDVEAEIERLELMMAEEEAINKDFKDKYKGTNKKAPVKLGLPFGIEKIEINLQPKNFNPTVISTYKKPVVELSEVIATQLENKSGEDRPITAIESVTIIEEDENHFGMDTYDWAEPDLFNKVILFAQNPDILYQVESLEARMKEMDEEHVKNMKELMKDLDRERDDKLDYVVKVRTAAEKRLVEHLKKRLESDIEFLKKSYEQNMQLEIEKMKQKFKIFETGIYGFYDSEETKLRRLLKLHDGDRRYRVEEELCAAQQLISTVFEEATLLRLTLAAEALGADNLRNEAVKFMHKDFSRYIDRPELGSVLLRSSTFQRIFAGVKTSHLHDVLDRPHIMQNSLAAMAVKKEISHRRRIVEQEYSHYSNVELRETLKGHVDFPDLLEKEIAGRRGSAGLVIIRESNLPSGVFVHDDDLTVELTTLQRYAVVQANRSITSGQFGYWYYELEIAAIDDIGATISVGWDVPRRSLEVPPGSLESIIPGLTPGGAKGEDFGITWQSDGLLHRNGVGEDVHTDSFKRGDIIGCVFDQLRGFVNFYVNGEKQITHKYDGDIPLRDPDHYDLLPCACMFATRSRNMCKVRFNFRGPFKFKDKVQPQVGLEAYGLHI